MKRRKKTALLLGLTIAATGVAGNTALDGQRAPGAYAVIKVKGAVKGTIVCRLFEQDAPRTVENFTGLAQGSKAWHQPGTGKLMNKKRYFDGLLFHRVIPNFMIQTGCPEGTGRGNPGFLIEDEFAVKKGGDKTVINRIAAQSDLDNLVHRFDRPGLLAMANTGQPTTNGSQFFITVAPTPWLNGKHTIFGEVVEGMDVVVKISEVKRGQMDRPVRDVKMDKVTIERVK